MDQDLIQRAREQALTAFREAYWDKIPFTQLDLLDSSCVDGRLKWYW